MAKESLEQRRKRVRKIIARLKKTHPDARLMLKFSNPLELLVALILSARTRDEAVNAVTPELFRRYRTASDWANEKPEVLRKHLRPINFYRTKTRAIQRACRVLVEKFGGQVPNRIEDLLKLPGVGRKTANALLGNAFGQPGLPWTLTWPGFHSGLGLPTTPNRKTSKPIWLRLCRLRHR
jgi:endonuclease III